jgi:hypothetical protein
MHDSEFLVKATLAAVARRRTTFMRGTRQRSVPELLHWESLCPIVVDVCSGTEMPYGGLTSVWVKTNET